MLFRSDVGSILPGKVAKNEFINYYTNISACIDNDDYFRILIRNAWHIGGENTEENSRKILVTRTDGSQVINFVLHLIDTVLSCRRRILSKNIDTIQFLFLFFSSFLFRLFFYIFLVSGGGCG